MSLIDWADTLLRTAENAQERVNRAFEPTVRLGVTGLSRSGKTVFITSLVANLLRRGRMSGLQAQAECRIKSAILTPQPDMQAPRFDFEAHHEALYASPPRWPQSTRSISQLRLSMRIERTGFLSGFSGDGIVHLDIVDYPGEWLLDLGLMGLNYRTWSEQALASVARRSQAQGFRDWLGAADLTGRFEEARAIEGAQRFTAYLKAAKQDGFAGVGPGRFLLPGEMEGAPALTFIPLPSESTGAYATEFERRFEGYKRHVVRPFFRDHFSRLDRQIVLVDLLSAISNGPEALGDLKQTLSQILTAFRPGENSWLAPLLGRRIDRLLLGVTKADHIHHSAHPALQSLVRDLLAQTLDRAAFKGAEVEAMALAALRATVEDEILQDGQRFDCVRGRLLGSGKDARLFPGEPPASLSEISGSDWESGDFHAYAFAPPILSKRENEGPPHIRLDRACEFLIGDKLT
ncbi:MAG: YcjX family protein [Neomegalonema sp.]|nr:YcjX family protein [Neomegalonema sp.]